MKRSLKRDWIQWMKDNPDKQIAHQLRNEEGGYCAIGALMHVYNPDKWVGIPTVLFYEICHAFRHHTGKYLEQLNDAGKTFAELIPLIEEYVPEDPEDYEDQMVKTEAIKELVPV